MKISPVRFGINNVEKGITPDCENQVQTTTRHNALADMEFNIIADTIRCQNLKNQMNVRLMNLRRNLNSCMAQKLYNNQ